MDLPENGLRAVEQVHVFEHDPQGSGTGQGGVPKAASGGPQRRWLAKVLWFDRSGYCVLAKRLERGTFQLPEVPTGARVEQVDAATLASLLAGLAGILEALAVVRGR